MNFKLECPRCDHPFDTISRMPRMLIDCGHTICGVCLKDLKNSGSKYTCPDDNKVDSTRSTLAGASPRVRRTRITGQVSEVTDANYGSFPINQMVLMLVNNKAKNDMEQQMRQEARLQKNRSKNHSEAEEINKLIQNMSSKLPRSEDDEFESNVSGQSSKKAPHG